LPGHHTGKVGKYTEINIELLLVIEIISS